MEAGMKHGPRGRHRAGRTPHHAGLPGVVGRPDPGWRAAAAGQRSQCPICPYVL